MASEVILFIDEMHTVIGAGSSGSGSLDFSNVIKPELAKGEISCIGVTTTNKYIELIESDGSEIFKLTNSVLTNSTLLRLLPG